MVVEQPQEPAAGGGYQAVTLATERGPVDARWYAAAEPHAAVLWVGGAGGGWDSPARGLYPALCEQLAGRGFDSLRLRFRDPTDLEDCVRDALVGIDYLERLGHRRLALVGHSAGGAVVIQAGAATAGTAAVVTLSTQSYGARGVRRLPGACALLMIHGRGDVVLPPAASQVIHDLAHQPKRLVLLDGAGHGLDEAAGEVRDLVRDFLVGAVPPVGTGPPAAAP